MHENVEKIITFPSSSLLAFLIIFLLHEFKFFFDFTCFITLDGWPGNSPDLNIIENVWSQMKHLQRTEQVTSVAGIKKIARKVWKAITPKFLQKLYKSLPQCMQAVIEAREVILNIDQFAIKFCSLN